MFGAGSDTTASAISVAIMAAACYPDAQNWVQKELDQVLGSRGTYVLSLSRYLNFMSCATIAPIAADMELLPRTYAYVLETFRWRPATAGGM